MSTQLMPPDNATEILALERRIKELDEQVRTVNQHLTELEKHMKGLQ